MVTRVDVPARRRHGRLRPALAVSMGVVLVLVTLFGIGATRAAWQDSEFARASLTTAVVPAPGTLTCSGGGTFVLGNTPPTVNFAWGAAGSPPNSLPVTDYHWTLTTGTTLIASGTTTTTARTAAITGTAVPAAGYYDFRVVARSASGWVSAPAGGTYRKTDAILGLLLGTSSCTVP